MGLFDLFTKSISNIINDEINSVTSKLERKIDNAITDLFSEALKKIGIGGKLGRELNSRFAQSIFSKRADKYLGKASSASDRMVPKEICNNMTPKASGSTSFTAAERQKLQKMSGLATFQYPQQDMQYYMKMSFKKYTRTTPQSRPKTDSEYTMILPLPKELSEDFGIRLSDAEAGVYGAGANIIQDAGSQAGSRAEKLIFQYAAGKLAEATGGTSNQFLGSIPNPFVTVMFQGINLRSFNFTWTFAPRNKEESFIIQSIIRKLKASALPAYTAGMAFGFLEYPMIVQIELYPWADKSKQSEDLILFKPAMIENISVNYAPNGIPSFFAGTNLPTFYQISLSFKEIEYFVADDFGGATGDVMSGSSKTSRLMNKALEGAESLPGIGEGIKEARTQFKDVVSALGTRIKEDRKN